MSQNNHAKCRIKEKRKFYRRKVQQIRGTYSYLGRGEEKFHCSINDINENGLHLSGERSFMVGDIIELEFKLNNKSILAHLDIIRVYGKSAGAKFSRINEDAQEFIRETLLTID